MSNETPKDTTERSTGLSDERIDRIAEAWAPLPSNPTASWRAFARAIERESRATAGPDAEAFLRQQGWVDAPNPDFLCTKDGSEQSIRKGLLAALTTREAPSEAPAPIAIERLLLLDLLAGIHGDGGQYTGSHGVERSVEEAHLMVAEWRSAAPAPASDALLVERWKREHERGVAAPAPSEYSDEWLIQRAEASERILSAATMRSDREAAAPAPTELLPHPGSPEASAMMDSVLAEYQWPANSKNAARAGYEAARRLLTPQAAAPAGPKA
jgi:hypothetical protein